VIDCEDATKEDRNDATKKAAAMTLMNLCIVINDGDQMYPALEAGNTGISPKNVAKGYNELQRMIGFKKWE
jgi:hypothetical protein